MKPYKAILTHLPQQGRLEWIGLRSARRAEVQRVEQVEVIEGLGLAGDHHSKQKPNPANKRQVTLIQAEHLPVIASLVHSDLQDAALVRRNLLVSGINLHALKDRLFYVGEALLEGTGFCHPCTRMEEALGAGGLNAMRGHGGITARVIKGGFIRLGASIRVANEEDTQ